MAFLRIVDGGGADIYGSLEICMVVAGEVVVAFTSEASFVKVGDVRLPLVPFIVSAVYDLSLLLLGDDMLIASNDAITFVDDGGHAVSLQVINVVNVDLICMSGMTSCR